MPDSGIIGQQRNDHDRRVRWQKVALYHDHQDTVILHDVETAQPFHEALTGDAMIFASG